MRLEGRARIEPLVEAYLKAAKAKLPALAEARALYDVLLGPIWETAQNRTLIIVRDGQLHLVPFDGLREPSGHFVVETRTVIYSPSATSFHLLMEQKQHPRMAHYALLAIGGIPYSRSPLNRSGLSRGGDAEVLQICHLQRTRSRSPKPHFRRRKANCYWEHLQLRLRLRPRT